jgi:hypothetical protein
MQQLYAEIREVEGVETIASTRTMAPVDAGEIRQAGGKPVLRPINAVGYDAIPSILRPAATSSDDIGDAAVTRTWSVDVELGRVLAGAHVDTVAERTRLLYITAGDGQAMVYRQKQDEAAAWLAAVANGDTPDPADYFFLKARAERLDAEDPDYQAVAVEWSERAAAWKAIAAHIEDIREGAKEAIATADSAGLVTILAELDFSLPA